MTTSNWTKQGETLSHKNAAKEFGLTEQEIFEAIKQGKLQYQISYAHANPYYKLLRMEVLAFVEDMHRVVNGRFPDSSFVVFAPIA